jgi:hypothetical protein
LGHYSDYSLFVYFADTTLKKQKCSICYFAISMPDLPKTQKGYITCYKTDIYKNINNNAQANQYYNIVAI